MAFMFDSFTPVSLSYSARILSALVAREADQKRDSDLFKFRLVKHRHVGPAAPTPQHSHNKLDLKLVGMSHSDADHPVR
jgi:hypothetical protein